jgi:hypothetical protein
MGQLLAHPDWQKACLFPLAQVKDALERTRTGQARFRTVLLLRQWRIAQREAPCALHRTQRAMCHERRGFGHRQMCGRGLPQSA